MFPVLFWKKKRIYSVQNSFNPRCHFFQALENLPACLLYLVPDDVLMHLPPLRQVSGVQELAWMSEAALMQPQGPRTTTRGPTTAEELASTTLKSLARPTQQPPTQLSSAVVSSGDVTSSWQVTTPTSLMVTPSASLSCKYLRTRTVSTRLRFIYKYESLGLHK